MNPNAPVFVQSMNQNQSNISLSQSFHKLPKISLPKFDGNIIKWQSFWVRSKIYSVEAGWTLRSLLCCHFHCTDKGQVAENFAKESVVFYLQELFQLDQLQDYAI
jgi:hypothetical protein